MGVSAAVEAQLDAAAEPVGRRVMRAVAVLALVGALQSTCTYAVQPELPVYLERRGASPSLVGLVIGSAFVAALLVQYPAGRLVDSLGHRRMLLGAALIFALGTAGYLLTPTPLADLGWRAVQGAASATTLVASLSYVAATLPDRMRGRGFSAVTASTISGIAFGPLLGGAFGLARFHGLWELTTGLAAAAVLLLALARLPDPAASPADAQASPPKPTPYPRAHAAGRPRWNRFGGGSSPQLRPGGSRPNRSRSALRSRPGAAVLLTAAAGGLLGGVYESCWTLLLVARHAGPGAITLSWSLFAAPFLLAAPLGGWLVDRADRRHLMLLALLVGSVFAFSYSVVRPVGWLLALGVFEGVATALAGPAAEAVLSRLAAPESLGRELGGLVTAQTAAQAVGSLSGGVLFAAALPLPFVAAGLFGLVAAWLVSVLLPARPARGHQ